MSPLCSVSIDVDPLPCYYRIHGLGPAPDELRHTVMRRCVPRFSEVLARRGIRATFFIVAEDVDVDAVGAPAARAIRALLAELCRDGHEIASHSHTHPYEMARLTAAEVAAEMSRAHELLSEIAGRPVRGFRAPGYDLSRVMMEQLVELEYLYDSSLFPAPGYYAVKAAVMGVLAVAGRPSGAVLTDPRALLAPANPYRPSASAPWRRGDAPIVELPVAVTRGLRLPVIGTNLLLAPAPLRQRLLESMRRRPFFNLEMHGIDLADAGADGVPGKLVARQADLRITVESKLAVFEAILDEVCRHYDVVTLAEAAEHFARRV